MIKNQITNIQWAKTCCQTVTSIITWTWWILFQSFPRSRLSTTTNDASKTHIQTKQFQNVFVVDMHFQNIKQITLEIHLSWQSWGLQKSEKIKINYNSNNHKPIRNISLMNSNVFMLIFAIVTPLKVCVCVCVCVGQGATHFSLTQSPPLQFFFPQNLILCYFFTLF